MTIHPPVRAFHSDDAHERTNVRLLSTSDPVSHLPPLVRALDRLDQGLVLTTSTSRIIYANPTAKSIFARAAFKANDGHLSGATPKATRDLRVTIADVALGVRSRAFSRLAAPDGKKSLLLTIVAASSHPADDRNDEQVALVFVGEVGPVDTPPIEMMRAFFDLTPSEARMAAEMIKGDGVKASAQRLGVTPSTARTHLKHVFDKTGTRRQAELAVLLLGCCPLGTGTSAVSADADIRAQRASPKPHCRGW